MSGGERNFVRKLKKKTMLQIYLFFPTANYRQDIEGVGVGGQKGVSRGRGGGHS